MIPSRPPYLLRRLYPGAVWRMNANEKKIFLTFDDGPVPVVTPAVLDILREHNVKATFFCVGKNVEKHSEIFQQIISEGHHVGNHTDEHADGWKHTKMAYLRQIQSCSARFQSGLFRPPYGRMRRSQFSAIKRKFRVVMWDVLTFDFQRSLTANEVLSIALDQSRNGSIVVFHDSERARERVLGALPDYISEMKSRGFEFGLLSS